jgi:hypothetical protein
LNVPPMFGMQLTPRAITTAPETSNASNLRFDILVLRFLPQVAKRLAENGVWLVLQLFQP